MKSFFSFPLNQFSSLSVICPDKICFMVRIVRQDVRLHFNGGFHYVINC